MELLFCGIKESESTCCGADVTPPRYDAHEFRFFHAVCLEEIEENCD